MRASEILIGPVEARLHWSSKFGIFNFDPCRMNDIEYGADKSHCLTPWASVFIGRATSVFIILNFIKDK